MKLINIKKLVELDMTLHTPVFIVIEFIGSLLLSTVLVASTLFFNNDSIWKPIVAFVFAGYAFNYLPLAYYAIRLIATKDYIFDPELQSADTKRRYSLQSLFIFIPFFIFIVSLFQIKK